MSVSPFSFNISSHYTTEYFDIKIFGLQSEIQNHFFSYKTQGRSQEAGRRPEDITAHDLIVFDVPSRCPPSFCARGKHLLLISTVDCKF